MGSSNNLAKEIISPGGYLSTDPTLSKFANWTKVVIMYCDGSQHQGHNNDPISYKDTQLYFRGSDNTRSHFQWLLNTYKINQAATVLLTGASAGGIATFSWTNYLRKKMDNPQNLYTVADSATFANVTFPKTKVHMFDILGENLFKVSNIDEKSPIEACNQKFAGKEYMCIFIENAYEFLDSKIMFLNSEYDEVGMEISMGMDCMKKGQSGKTLKNCS